MASAKTAFTIKGYDIVAGKIRARAREITDRIVRNQRQEAQQILSQAVEYAPERDGDLRGSGKLVLPDKVGTTQTTVAVTFGGESAPHAVAVHENPGPHDPPTWQGKAIEFSPTGTGAKFLEKATNERAKGMGERLSK